jgi:hypothetical protein
LMFEHSIGRRNLMFENFTSICELHLSQAFLQHKAI